MNGVPLFCRTQLGQVLAKAGRVLGRPSGRLRVTNYTIVTKGALLV